MPSKLTIESTSLKPKSIDHNDWLFGVTENGVDNSITFVPAL